MKKNVHSNTPPQRVSDASAVRKPIFRARTRGEKFAQAAGVFLQALVLSVLILSAVTVLLSYVGTYVVFRYQNF